MIHLRVEETTDRAFLLDLFFANRHAEWSSVPLGEADLRQLIEHQFYLQTHHYRTHFSQANYFVVAKDSHPIGRIIMHCSEARHHLVDICLMPEQCGYGIGSRLMDGVIERSDAANIPLTLHVVEGNRAHRLYARKGFQVVDRHGPHLVMARHPKKALSPAFA